MSERKTFAINDKNYRLHYTEGRLEMIENRLGKSVVSEFIQSNGALPIASVKAHFSYALVCEDDPDVYVKPKDGAALASAYMREHGYATVCDILATGLEADLGFLFRAG